MKVWGSRRLMAVALVGVLAPLHAADTKVDLSKETVGKLPVAFDA